MQQAAIMAALREECDGLRKENAELKDEIKLLQKELYDLKEKIRSDSEEHARRVVDYL